MSEVNNALLIDGLLSTTPVVSANNQASDGFYRVMNNITQANQAQYPHGGSTIQVPQLSNDEISSITTPGNAIMVVDTTTNSLRINLNGTWKTVQVV